MTRLFFRFYVGVLLILFGAWWVQTLAYRHDVSEQNVRVVERAMAGSLRVARDWLDSNPTDDEELVHQRQTEILEQIKLRFEFPVRLVPIDDEHFPGYAATRLQQHDDIVLYSGNGQPLAKENSNTNSGDGSFVATRLRDPGLVVSMGPLPQFVGPEQSTLLTALGAILLLAAAAIAVLLRPVARQLREVETTAMKIAAGNLSARIEKDRVPHGQSLASAFNTMADRSESLLRTQRELLQAVSHDLRTPLAKIRFCVDLIGSAKTEEDRNARLASLDDSTEELDGLVGELLNYVRMETEERVVAREELNVASIVEELVDRRRELHPDIEFDVAIPKEQELSGNPNGVQRVLANLVGNACRFAKKKVRVSTTRQNGHISLLVEDDGPGIPMKDRERVLNPFVRLQQDDDSKPNSGVGLGLALVSRILQRHGGSVAVDESSLGGCKVRTDWPVDQSQV